MRLLEHEGRDIFAKYGIAMPSGIVARSVEEAERAAESIGYPVVIKAQVLTGEEAKRAA
jgi:succinyl-CoA synthetase beta subunit